ncbi:winged helix-turn-helix domain-containing protein [Desmospora activa]|uniref:Winged helix-turn-helix domain-containing protein n=1 Tax=Desmospora activa DSM 45169 TaxID=1121389 RepID=A0A2T4Z9N4_9BACL|nr:crosslink repair DNA glycosylase YcaQ family protein [Desmospora activa]PTM58575.1 hypothetical protein C8J48_1160 [Desmospora activa DSM 45169]
MATPFTVSRRAVRRFLLDVQGLLSVENKKEPPTADNVLEMIKKLECVQLDPVSVVERNQHLVLAARMPGYQPTLLHKLLQQGKLFEYLANAACAIPIEDYPLFKPTRERIGQQLQPRLDELAPVIEQVLKRLEVDGPLPSRTFDSNQRVHGYWDNQLPKTKDTSLALNLLVDTGTIRVVRREGSERFFDLSRRTVPQQIWQEAETIDTVDAREQLLQKYLCAYRVFDPGDPRFGWSKMSASQRRQAIQERVQKGSVIPLQIEGIRRNYFILASDLDRLQTHAQIASDHDASAEGPIRFLPPLDNLLWRRERVEDLFGFSYKWEIYVPRAKRRYGPYAMPILADDRLIGRIDPQMDRKNGVLTIRLLQVEPDIRLTPRLRQNLDDALQSFARFHGVDSFKVEMQKSKH